MSEDRFYSQVRAAMSEHRPEVPASVYHGMRKKMWWSNFTRLSITRFNIWYALFILGGLGTWVGVANSNQHAEQPAEQTSAQPVQEQIVIPSEPLAPTAVAEETNQTNSAAPALKSKEVVVNKKKNTPQQEVSAEHADVPTSTDTEKQLEVPVTTAEAQTEQPVKKGSKRGLKITTYNSGENKK